MMLSVPLIQRIPKMLVVNGRSILETDSVAVPQKMKTKMHKRNRLQEQ